MYQSPFSDKPDPQLQAKWLTCIKTGDPEAIKQLLSEGHDLNKTDGLPPVCIAILEENIEITKLLLDLGADPRIEDDMPFFCAVRVGNIDLAKELIGCGVDVNHHFKCGERIMNSGVGLQPGIGNWIYNKYKRAINLPSEADDREGIGWLIYLTIYTWNLSMIQFLVENGLDIHIGNDLILMFPYVLFQESDPYGLIDDTDTDIYSISGASPKIIAFCKNFLDYLMTNHEFSQESIRSTLLKVIAENKFEYADILKTYLADTSDLFDFVMTDIKRKAGAINVMNQILYVLEFTDGECLAKHSDVVGMILNSSYSKYLYYFVLKCIEAGINIRPHLHRLTVVAVGGPDRRLMGVLVSHFSIEEVLSEISNHIKTSIVDLNGSHLKHPREAPITFKKSGWHELKLS